MAAAGYHGQRQPAKAAPPRAGRGLQEHHLQPPEPIPALNRSSGRPEHRVPRHLPATAPATAARARSGRPRPRTGQKAPTTPSSPLTPSPRHAARRPKTPRHSTSPAASPSAQQRTGTGWRRRCSGGGRWQGLKALRIVRGRAAGDVCARNRTKNECDEIDEEQRARFGEKDGGRMTMSCIQAVYI
jgi:hypothetical protein